MILKIEDYKILEENSSGGKIDIYVLPENIYAVPSFSPPTHDSPLEYIHIHKEKCPITSCKEKKTKLHSLVKKEAPICIHTVLVHSSNATLDSSTTAAASSSSSTSGTSTTVPEAKKKIKNPKINRDLTTKVVMDEISKHFPTMTKMNPSGFVTKSRSFVEKLVSSPSINQTIDGSTRKLCTACPETLLELWPFKPKQAFLLSLGHMTKIDIPVKFCRKCRRIFYPGRSLGSL